MTSPNRPVLHGEKLDGVLDQIVRYMDEVAAADADTSDGTHSEASSRAHAARLILIDWLRESLEDEVVPAVEAAAGQIQPYEVAQEIIKKALVGLKMDQLKSIARSSHIVTGGTLEDLATRIARHYKWDSGEIASLILEHEEDPNDQHSTTSRLFPLTESVGAADVEAKLRYVLGRYIRIGVARWFVFQAMVSGDGEIRLEGSLRSYQANVVTGVAEEPTVEAGAREDRSVQVLMQEDRRYIRTNGARDGVSAAAVKALATATAIRPVGSVEPIIGAGVQIGMVAPASVLLLDLIATRLRSASLQDPNLRTVRFRVGGESTSDDDDRPALKAIRLEGNHIVDSPSVCRLIAEGRSLVDITALLSPPKNDGGARMRFPVRIGIERDHITVTTGYSTAPGVSLGIHEQVVDAVAAELMHGVANPTALNDLLASIAERAAAAEVPRATLFASVGRESHDPARTARRATTAEPADEPGGVDSTLTQDELAVLALIRYGASMTEIATALNMSRSLLGDRLGSLLSKLNVGVQSETISAILQKIAAP